MNWTLSMMNVIARYQNRLLSFFKGQKQSLSRLFMLGSVVVILCACVESVNLQTGLNDADANEIVTLLNRYGIEVKKRVSKEGVTLTVVEKDLSRATEAMRGAGLPRQGLSNLGAMFKKEGMISTPLEERVRYIHGLSQELESTLQQFDQVVTARVHVVLPERVAPGEPIQPSSAAVFIKHRQPLDEDTIIPRIRNLVASSIPGLSGEDGRSKVTVVLTPTETVPPGIEWEMVGPFRVIASSASLLNYTLVGLMTFAGISFLFAAGLFAMRRPKVDAWVKKRFGKKKPTAA
jgi:type III secretion protein J